METNTALATTIDQTVINIPAKIKNADLKHVPLNDIQPDPKQPRKFFAEGDMQEMIDSVRVKGVLQAITLRNNPGKGKPYLLVCGERRYRAAMSVMAMDKTRNTIPAGIQELTDEEALQLQIIENLQRKDVHPMEEAVAINSLLENSERPLTIEEVAAKLAKPVFYVRQRKRLNSLTKEWQDVFYKRKINTTLALDISTLASKDQEDFFKKKIDVKRINQPDYFPQISDWDLNNLKRHLKSAPFDIKDATLNPDMGACTACPFNSAVLSLFPDDAKDPRCTNAVCFNTKCDTSFKRDLTAAKENPAVVLIYNHLYNQKDGELKAQLQKEGHKIYETGPDCISSDSWQYKELKGVPVKGFYIGGNERGRYVQVKIKTKASSTNTKEKAKAGTLAESDIVAEISRINEREKRSKELDLQKVHIATCDALKGHKILTKASLPMQPVDRGIMVYLLLELSGLIHDKVTGIPDDPGERHQYHEKYFEKLSKISDDTLALVIRMIVADRYLVRNLQWGVNTEDTTVRLIANYAGIDLSKIESDQKDASAKREERVKARLASLNKQKADLKPKSSTKKTAKKSPAKKK